MSVKFIFLLPFLASAFYGLSYALIEKTIGVHVNPATFLVVNTCANVAAILFLIVFKNNDLDFSALGHSVPYFLMIIVAASAPALGWVLTIYSIKNMSALFTALAETSYPLFTMMFGFLIFGIKELNWLTFFGGCVVMIGAVIMIVGRAQMDGHE